MMCFYFKSRWVKERRADEEAIKHYCADKSEVRRLEKENFAQDIEMNSFRTTYSRLQGQMRAQTYVLKSTKQRMAETYNHIDFLERGMTDLKKNMAKLKRVRETLRDELGITRKEVQNSCTHMENLKNSSQVFWTEYEKFVSIEDIRRQTFHGYVKLVFI